MQGNPKVVPIRARAMTRDKLIRAVATVLADVGFEHLSAERVAAEAAVNVKQIFCLFGGLQGLVAAYAQSPAFWPSAGELLEDDGERLGSLPPHAVLALFFKRSLRALLDRPETLKILGWEYRERNALSRELEEVRVRSALEFFEGMAQDPPADVDLTAVVLVLAGAVQFLAVQSRLHGALGGVDLRSEAGWARIEATIDRLLLGMLGQ